MIKKTLFIVLIASCMSWGQRPDTPGAVRQALAGGGSPGSVQAAPPAPARIEVTSASVPRPITNNSQPQPAESTVAAGEVLTSIRPHTGKRDPFVSPIAVTGPVQPSGNCSSGKKCLVINQIVLRGVVKTATGMIAVVANSLNKAYFLRENDPVFNGYVIRITGDSVVFKENTVDAIGRQGTREVVKKVSPPSA